MKRTFSHQSGHAWPYFKTLKNAGYFVPDTILTTPNPHYSKEPDQITGSG